MSRMNKNRGDRQLRGSDEDDWKVERIWLELELTTSRGRLRTEVFSPFEVHRPRVFVHPEAPSAYAI